MVTSSPRTPADIVVELVAGDAMTSMPVPVAAWKPVSSTGALSEAHTPRGQYLRLRYSGAGCEAEFVLGPEGRRLWASWNEKVGLEDITAMLLGPILACVLRLQGRTFLHGSVVALGERALAFLGPPGAGKSTTALALVQRGAELVSDDIGLLVEADHGFSMAFGAPSLRLRPGPADALCGSFEQLRPLWSEVPERPAKRCLDVSPRSDREPFAVPLHTIYVLADRDPDAQQSVFVPVRRATALTMLMAHRSGTFLLDRAAHARDLALLSRLAMSVPVKQLYRREGLEGIAEFTDAILADASIRS